MEEEGDIPIFETSDGSNGTITIIAWPVFEYKNHKQRLLVYQDKSEVKVRQIFNAVKKAWIQGRDLPILIVINYATLLNDKNETESLSFPY